ncbi:Sec20 [Hexamita inflata]|uniref:Sec20 n=1 Tax=Hexamita inflata TaxID=28002 RepID=A0AA86R1Y5_9EUKA|nr:Sec20 [Hexamita inflata]
MQLDIVLDSLEELLIQTSQTLHDFKICVINVRWQKGQNFETISQQIEKCLLEYKEMLRQAAVVPVSTRSRHKQLQESFISMKREYLSVKNKQQQQKPDELLIQASTVNIQYTNQTNQLRDINRRVEESVYKIQLNNQQVQNQDEQLQRVNNKFTHIQSKAENAGQLVNNMRQKEKRSSRILQIVFALMGIANVAMIVVVVMK